MIKLEHYSGISKEEYNAEPVFYCKSCLSLHVMPENGMGSYCQECGSAAVGRTNIDNWTEMYHHKYEKDFLTELDVPYEKCKYCEHKN